MLNLFLPECRELLTPALLIDEDDVENNIAVTLRLLGGDAERWRPHVKTAKVFSQMQKLVERGVRNFKCATTLELLTVCQAGARDVLVAYPCWGPRAHRVREIAEEFPGVNISTLIDSPEALEDGEQLKFAETGIGVFLDLNPGMNRTGFSVNDMDAVAAFASRIQRAGLQLRGLHYYDGHQHAAVLDDRKAAAFRGYENLLTLIHRLTQAGLDLREVITSGTPAFPCAIAFEAFRSSPFTHRVSPGTVLYNDATSLKQLPQEWGYRAAVTVMTTVVSHPSETIATCDAGHKAVSADAGDPTCEVVGYPGLIPIHPSEEHLPIRLESGAATPKLGERLLLVPKHVCPTVNNFDHAVIVKGGRISRMERVAARGREAPAADAVFV